MNDIPLIDPPVQALTLADGRRMTWQAFGSPDGRPVLYFHGGGSASFEAGIFHREAVQNNIRLIATNRPSVGGSTAAPGRGVTAYCEDLRALLDELRVEKFACLGESNGGMVTLAVASTLSARVLGAIPINPTIPWFDPVAKGVSSRMTGIAYSLLKYAPGLLTLAAEKRARHVDMQRSRARNGGEAFKVSELLGPPPGIEDDIGDIHWRLLERSDKQALRAEFAWATARWSFDYYDIPVPLDFFCGVRDSAAPFSLVLADRNPDARFHHFSYGHHGFSHPKARRRIFETIASYLLV